MARGDGIRLREGRQTYSIQVGVQVVGRDGKKRLKVIERSLHTTSRTGARLRAAVERARILEQFAAIKAGMPIADDELRRIENEEMRRAYDLLSADFLNAHPKLDKYAADLTESAADPFAAAIDANPILGGLPTFTYAESKLRQLGRDPSSEAIMALSVSILKAHVGAVAALQRNVQPPPLPDRLPPVAPKRVATGAAPKVVDFGNIYLADRTDLAAKTKLQARLSFRLLADHCDNCAFDAIDRATASAFVHKLVKSGLASATVNRHLTAISKAFKWGQNHGRISEDARSPWSGLWRTAPRNEEGEPIDNEWEAYEDRELRALFKGLCLVSKPKRFGECLPWVMAIGLYSGMRLSEICGLTAADVRREHGILVMDVRRSKTRAGKRLVPVHPELVKLGLPAVVRAAGKSLLFPKANGNYTARRFTIFRRDHGCTRDGLSFHSLRKNFVTAAEDAGVPDTTIAALVGHKGRRGFTLSKYAPKPRLRLLAAAVAKVGYRGLRL